MSRARYIMVGGFLGAGKSTSVGRLARRLTDEGCRVGLITNDQAAGLVDTSSLRSQGFAVEEIAGGCFCCRFDSLRSAAEDLRRAERPDVFIAEPVGSCTDLVATVSYPLRRIYGERFRIAPLSVVVDPLRALRVLGLEEGRRFSPRVLYVYRKQLEEADLIVVNKRDLIDGERLDRLRAALEREYPAARVLSVSARRGDGLDEWFDRVLADELVPARDLDIDYDTYADGEAQLGWLNATLELRATEEVDPDALLDALARGLQARLEAAESEVAHLKMTLSPIGDAAVPGSIAVVNLARSDAEPEPSARLGTPLRRAEVIVNLRAEGAPETLRGALAAEVERLAATRGTGLRVDHAEAFRPGRPEPTHRLTASTVSKSGDGSPGAGSPQAP